MRTKSELLKAVQGTLQFSSVSEISLRYTIKIKPEAAIRCSKDAFDIFKEKYEALSIDMQEYFFLMLLNKSNKVLGIIKLSEGGVAGTVVDIRYIAALSVMTLSSSVVLCHNHPSGNIKPSQADIDLTRKVKEGLKLLDVALIDHLILPGSLTWGYYSFADDGLL